MSLIGQHPQKRYIQPWPQIPVNRGSRIRNIRSIKKLNNIQEIFKNGLYNEVRT